MANRQSPPEHTAQSSGQGGYVRRHRPRLGLIEVLLHLWRAKFLMLLVFLPIFGAGTYFATKAPAHYVSRTELILNIDDGYFISASVATAPISVEDIFRVEINLLHSPQIAGAVVRRFGLERLYPNITAGFADRAGVDIDLADQGAARLLEDFTVGAVPDRRLIFAEFAHEDAVLATEVLNALIGAYFGYRAEVLASQGGSPFTGDRRELEAQLMELEEAVRIFSADNGLSDFLTERSSLNAAGDDLRVALIDVEASLAVARDQVARTRQEIEATDPFLEKPDEESAAMRIVALQAERDDLLGRYLETSQTVRALDERIDALRSEATDEADGGGDTLRIPNPDHAELALQLSAFQQDVASVRRRRSALQDQLQSVSSRKADLMVLEPRWQELQRRRAEVEAALRNLTNHELGIRRYLDAVGNTSDTIRVVEPATIDRRLLTSRLPIFLVFLLLALIAAFSAGILRAIAKQGFTTARSLEQSTGLPVVSTVSRQ